MLKFKVFLDNLGLLGTKLMISFRHLMLALFIVSFVLPPAHFDVSAQQANSPWYSVRSIFTSEYGLASPKGLAYLPRAKAFLVWDRFGAVTGSTMQEDPLDTQGLRISSEDFRNLAFNGKTNRLFMLNNNHTQLDEFSVNAKGLPQAALDWVPGQDMNSISVLVFHTTGSVRFWIGDVAAQEPSNRDRDAEFRVKGVEVAVLKKRLADNLEYSRNALEKMSLQDLATTRINPGNGSELTVAWALLHALEHATSHLGQIQITRQLWEQKGGDS